MRSIRELNNVKFSEFTDDERVAFRAYLADQISRDHCMPQAPTVPGLFGEPCEDDDYWLARPAKPK